ncbi:hypothetical protein F5X98DRAFT_10994 [Xylaria grammica]|nr:hypothetical protein F5X98DRAFT_10994 [Xylaria grammica]
MIGPLRLCVVYPFLYVHHHVWSFYSLAFMPAQLTKLVVMVRGTGEAGWAWAAHSPLLDSHCPHSQWGGKGPRTKRNGKAVRTGPADLTSGRGIGPIFSSLRHGASKSVLLATKQTGRQNRVVSVPDGVRLSHPQRAASRSYSGSIHGSSVRPRGWLGTGQSAQFGHASAGFGVATFAAMASHNHNLALS